MFRMNFRAHCRLSTNRSSLKEIRQQRLSSQNQQLTTPNSPKFPNAAILRRANNAAISRIRLRTASGHALCAGAGLLSSNPVRSGPIEIEVRSNSADANRISKWPQNGCQKWVSKLKISIETRVKSLDLFLNRRLP